MQRSSAPISRSREALRDLLLLLVVVLVVLVLLLALLILLPVLAFLAGRDRKRLCTAAEATPCARCGRSLGFAAVEAADAAWAAFFAGMLARHLRPRVIRRLLARCPSCGAGHGWDERRRVLHLLPVELWDLSAPPQ